MSGPIATGEGRPFRRRGLVERAARAITAATGRQGYGRSLRGTYEAALWALTGGRGLRADLPGGETVRLIPECRGLSWNPQEYAAFREATRDGDIVIDAGASAGAYTVLFANWVGRAGRVYAFEPSPAVARLLARQVQLNGVGDRVSIVRAALGGAAGAVPFVAAGPHGDNRIAPSAESAGAIPVPLVTLDEFCDRERIVPAVAKIDVEGAELEVLRGARRTIAAAPGLRLFVELHPTLWTAYGVTAAALREELDLQGLRAEPLRGGADVWQVEGVCARLVRR